MTTESQFETIVIGNGLIGSAAGRYLAEWGQTIAIIGPGEPQDHASHGGVFASHYDQGRLCTNASRDPVWQPIGAQAVANYPRLEAESGIPFHNPVGWLHATRMSDEERAGLVAWIDSFGRTSGVDLLHFAPSDRSWEERFPMVTVPDGYDLFFEPAPAGYVNPRQLLAAQNTIAKQHGAVVIDQRATNVTATAGCVTVRTEDGNTYEADRALIACGAFTNFADLVPEPIPLRCKTESTIWATVSPETAAELAGMPGLGYDIDDPDIDDIYMAPPILYPDGSHKIKMGCNTAGEFWPETLEQLQQWFKSGSSDDDLPAMERALRRLLPLVEFLDVSSHRCIVTYTPSGYPTIDAAPGDITGRLFVATGGNGSSAQGSDTLGHTAAGLLYDGRWMDELPRQMFLATNDWGDATKRLTKAQARANDR